MERLSSGWYKDPETLRRLVEDQGSIRKVAATTGVGRSTLQEWWERHNLPPRTSASTGTTTLDPKWGDGRPQLLRAATREPWELVVFLSDLHFPYHEQALCDAALDLIADLKPHRVVLNGDLVDMFQISRFNKSHEREGELQADIDLRNDYVASVRDAAGTAVLEELEGNHDHRIRSYVSQNAKPLQSLRALQPANLFNHKELGVRWHPGCGFMLRRNFLVKHGNRVSSVPGGTARSEAMANMCSGISGHAHRAERFHKAGSGGRLEWNVTGTMSRLDADYVQGVPDWTQGIAIGEFSTRTEAFLVTQVPWMDNALRFGAARYGAVAA